MRPADRLLETMLEAGVQPHKVKSTIARICGIQAPSVHQWFSGRTEQPKAEHLAAIAKAYNVSLYWVVTGKGPKHSVNAETEAEALILDLYRSLPDDLQAIATRQLSALSPQSRDSTESE